MEKITILYLKQPIIKAELMEQLQQGRSSKKQIQMTNKLVNNILLGSVQAQPEGISPMEQLDLNYDKNDTKDINELRQILSQILSYPSSEIALLHMKANRLGELDLKQSTEDLQAYSENYKKISENAKFCPCCGFIVQDSKLSICTNIQDINHLGVSTFLYFETIKNIIKLLTLLFFVFSIYALVSNVIAADRYKDSLQNDVKESLLSFEGVLRISLGSKQIHSTEDDKISYTVQCWLGVAVLALWGVYFGYVKHTERVKSIDIDNDSRTASDFTILIKNFPSNMTKQQLQKQLLQYQQNLGEIFLHEAKTPISIAKINKASPFYLNYEDFDEQSLNQLNKEYKKYREQYVQWIVERIDQPKFSVSDEQRQNIKKRYLQVKQKRMDQYKRIATEIKKVMIARQAGQTTPTFVTFNSSYNKQFLEFMHEDSSRLINSLPCSNKNKYFHFKRIGERQDVMAQIRAAHEPEDIIWTNQGQSNSSFLKKRLITFGISILVLGASFGAVYGLSKVQTDYAKTHSDVSNQYISILISLCISIINIIIQQIFRLLTKIERNETYTRHQSSLALKAIVALLINSILIPILVNYFFKNNLYGVNGLAYDVFFLGLTNSFLSPLLKIFDIYYFFTRFWRWYKDTPIRKIPLNQNQLNTTSEYMEFEIGYEYIYIVNLFLFTCFFSPLQPIIVVFAIVGLFVMFWAQKYSLFQRCKRPSPGLNIVNNTMYQLIYLGPACFTLGSFCWSNFFQQNFIGIAPNLTAAIISGVIFLLPYRKLVKSCFSYVPQIERHFQPDRIFMPSQYDRLNPATSAAGIEDYKNYLIQYKKKIAEKKIKNPLQYMQLERIFMKQYGAGCHYNQPILPELVNYIKPGNGDSFNQNQIILQQLFGTNQNVFNPFLIGHAMLNNQQQLNVAVQNWLTFEEGQTVTYQDNGNNTNNNNNGIGNPGKFGYKRTESISSPNGGEDVMYTSKPIKFNNDGGLKVLYDVASTVKNEETMGKKKLAPIGTQQKRQSKQIPINIPINIFGSLAKLTQGNTNPIQNNNQPNDRYATNNNNNLFGQIPPPNNLQSYDPYSININSQQNLMNRMAPGILPNPPPQNYNPYYNNNQYQNNPYPNRRY